MHVWGANIREKEKKRRYAGTMRKTGNKKWLKRQSKDNIDDRSDTKTYRDTAERRITYTPASVFVLCFASSFITITRVMAVTERLYTCVRHHDLQKSGGGYS